ncbi:unnamed protein product [Macrosiphum euphorbiae]|uniref:Polyprotein n=1 Tax=Macrosiphum euphorbiae TaxID=13131 RepID=A0AAV0WTZ2_9HEMI|nr:unnamed protein product [Macrosiphum euphorbiae]
MFLHTLGLKEWSVRNWVLKSSTGSGINVSPDYDKKTKKVGRKIITNKEMTTIFDNLPALPSHYCRSNSNKMYLESFFETKLSLNKAYVATLHNNDNAVNKTNFFKEFQRRNLALYSPKKDLCDLCEGYKYSHINQEVYDHHQQRKKDARDAKNVDKQLAMHNPTKYVSLTMDVQAVKLARFIRASSMYYKTKLCVHNFTVFNQATADVCCYLCDEIKGGLEASIFSTMMVDYLDNIIQRKPTVSNISIYNDGCGYQNRNTTVYNSILKFAID